MWFAARQTNINFPNLANARTLAVILQVVHMTRYKILSYSLLLFQFACTEHVKQKNVSTTNSFALQIHCENEKFLLESNNNNKEYSFDTIRSTRRYWKYINHDQGNSIGKKIYPFTTLTTDTPTLYRKIKLGIIGYGEWKPDLRLKTILYEDVVDTNRVISFLKKLSDSESLYQNEIKHQSEICLSFRMDSITNIQNHLKTICKTYLSFLREYSLKLFNSDICSLSNTQLAYLKVNFPLRIRLLRSF